MSELVARLEIKSGMMKMGEKIAWGSDTALMDEAAARITALEQENATLKGNREVDAGLMGGLKLVIKQLEQENARLREAGSALIDFHNGPLEAKRPDLWQRLLTRFSAAMEQSK
jgi:hypothetical protein